MKWIIAFLIFSLLVLFHEFGHFLVAKMNGVVVEEFSLGFGPRLLSTVRGGTRYSLKLLLFGGSCQMKGMYEIYDDEDEENAGPREPEEGSFEGASIGRRAAIIFAGPFFNFILAFVCSIIIISVVGYDPPEVISVREGSPASEAGLEAGDIVTEFMGDHIAIGRDISSWFVLHDLAEGQEVSMSYTRNGEEKEIRFVPAVNVRYMLGMSYNADDEAAVIQSVGEGSPLYNAGVRAGDVITSINGNEITTALSMRDYFSENPLDGSEVRLVCERDGTSFETSLIPYESRTVDVGFSYNLGRVNTTPIGVLKYSLIEMRYWIVTTVKSVGQLFTGRFTVNDLSGPVGVVDIVGETYEEVKSEGALMTWMNMLNMIVLLSSNLGVMNLLPIPAVDGGRLLFLAIEAIRRKPMNRKLEGAIQMVTVALLLFLMFYVMYHDMVRMLAH